MPRRKAITSLGGSSVPKTKYTQRIDGEGFEIPNKTIYKLACCDCGLVHRIVLAAPGIKKGVGIGFASARDNRATAQIRRRKSQNSDYPHQVSR